MQHCHPFFRMATSVALLATTMATGSAIASQGTVDFFANIKTTEFLLPAENCNSKLGGIGVGAGTTNLFTTKPEKDRTTAVLSSFDCVNPSSDGSTFFFGPGRFTLTGPGGDTIFATYSGTLYYNGVDPATKLPVYKFNNDTMFNITGGTGRYAKAAGSGTISGTETINQATGTAQGSLAATGKIIY